MPIPAFRWTVRLALTGLLIALVVAAAGPADAETALRIVPQADLKILDTVWTTNNITSNHGYLIYDVLFAPNAKLEYKPQMVDTYSKSADGLTWTFKLRDGLKFSDGSPVESKDVVASIKRYGDRIPVGKTLMQFTKEVVATGPTTFEIRLAKPFGPVLEVLGTPENPLFIHREKEAVTPSDQQITEAIGSGPFVSGSPAARSSTRRTRSTSRGPTRPTASPAPSSPRSTASSGWSSRTPTRRPRP